MSDVAKRSLRHGSVQPGISLPINLLFDLLKRGETMGTAATRCGVDAKTAIDYYADSLMSAERAALLAAMEERVRFRLNTLAHRAVDVIEEALEQGHAGVAIELLAGLGVLAKASREEPARGPVLRPEDRRPATVL